MPAKKRSTVLDLSKDDALDLLTKEWRDKFAKAKVVRGRPKAAVTKVSTTIRIDADVLEAYRSDGPGWQSRINSALRKAAKLPA